MATRARMLFESIVNDSDPANVLHGFIHPPQKVESEILDYKAGAKLQSGDQARLWSKALSGFANTEGGVIVWGIDARKEKVADQKGVERLLDVPRSTNLLADPMLFAQQLRELVRDATEHPVLGVEIVPVIEPGQTGDGFVVCFVPSGSDKPYCSTAESRYLMRAHPLSHTMLRAMFYPRLQPRLQLSLSMIAHNQNLLSFQIHVHNTGTASARGLVADVQTDKPVQSITGGSPMFSGGVSWSGAKGGRILAQRELHPHDNQIMAAITWNMPESPGDPPHFTVAVYMTDQEPAYFTAEVNRDCLKVGAKIDFTIEDGPST